MTIFMMQNVDQMTTSLSLYVLIQIKLNKYIKINIYWTKKKNIYNKKYLTYYNIILLISLIIISTVLLRENYDWLPVYTVTMGQLSKLWKHELLLLLIVLYLLKSYELVSSSCLSIKQKPARILKHKNFENVFVLENLPIKMFYSAHVSHIFDLSVP